MSRLCLALLGLLLSLTANAHEIRPAFLQISEQTNGHIEALWKQPAAGEVAVHLQPRLSSGWLDGSPDQIAAAPAFLIKRWHINQPGQGLEGQTLTIEGLENTITDVLVVIEQADGHSTQAILKPQYPSMTIPSHGGTDMTVLSYFRLGVEHILTGIDHLMFVLGLLLLVKDRVLLVKTITAFTVAHSITLSCAALNLVKVYPPVVEAVIALSIVFLALELVRANRGRFGLAARYPWLIAFSFGLLHGFGFAGALLEIGLPKNDVPLSLFLFNVGVEAGQLLFVLAVLLLIQGLRRLPSINPVWGRWVPPYAIGSFSAYWLIERLSILAV
ncbi:MAG: HupE/UreJ family protein [Candidatus Methylumidiphilus sp.]